MPNEFVHPFVSPAKTSFVNLVSGHASTVVDDTGKEYIDAMASLWYCNVGHGRREIAEAVAKQIETLETYSCFDPFTNPAADEFAARAAQMSPLDNARVFLCQSGSESVDTAIKLARISQIRAGRPDKTLIISRERGYHGTNLGGTSAQGLPLNKEGWGPLVPNIIQTDSDDIEQLSQVMSSRSKEVAAVLVEPVQGAGGVWPPEQGYLEAVRRLCDQHGAYLIFDEVITGFGRLGSWFASQHFGVTPDITTFAKGVTSGYQPLGGVLMSKKVWEPLADEGFVLRHGYTYSGHSAACVAAGVNLDIMERENLLDGATRIADRLGGGLGALAADGTIAQARGVGGMWAAEMNPDINAADVRSAMLNAGVIVRGIEDHTLVLCPPLVITDDEIDRVVDAMSDSIAGQRS